jgi:TolB-like protein
VKQIAHELGVHYIVEGSVRKSGNRVRITGQLIDSTTGAHIWGIVLTVHSTTSSNYRTTWRAA